MPRLVASASASSAANVVRTARRTESAVPREDNFREERIRPAKDPLDN
jgi:hypothetical protein